MATKRQLDTEQLVREVDRLKGVLDQINNEVQELKRQADDENKNVIDAIHPINANKYRMFLVMEKIGLVANPKGISEKTLKILQENQLTDKRALLDRILNRGNIRGLPGVGEKAAAEICWYLIFG